MGRLLVILTGGTISSGWDEHGKAPVSTAAKKLHKSLTDVFEKKDTEVIFRAPLGIPGIDSSEMTPVEWVKITKCIVDELKNGLIGILILHGTDTMANTASWLDLCFGNLPIPIILTGSQLTLDYMPEDVTSNLRGAAMACCSDLKGVWVYFNWKLIPAVCAHKSNSLHPDAFVALNGQPVFFNPDWALGVEREKLNYADGNNLSEGAIAISNIESNTMNSICKSVYPFFALPGVPIRLNGDEQILCLIGFGSGNILPSVLDAIEQKYKFCEKPLVVACSQAEGGVKNPEGYALVGIARLVLSGFRVWSQVDRSIEFIYSLCCYSLALSPKNPALILGKYLRECRI